MITERYDSPSTVRRYVSAVKQLKQWARRKRKSLTQLTVTDCRRWLITLSKEAYTTSSINVMHSAAQVFFRFLASEGDLSSNPFESIPYLPKQKTSPRFLDNEEIERLLAAPDISTYDGLLDRAILELFYSSGLRVAELINLRIMDLNLEKRLLICLGKRSKQRWVIFGDGAREWLKKYLSARSSVPGAKKSPYLFLQSSGQKLNEKLVWRHVRAQGLRANLADVSPHVLRHSFATHLYAGGAATSSVQELLGHEDMESTEVYTHPVQEHLKKIYDRHHPRSSLKRGPPRPQHARQKRRR
jgi:site-specific recombinase XerD